MKQFELDKDLNNELHAKSIELAGLERLIGFSMSATEYEIPEEKLESLMEKHKNINAKYEELKAKVSKIVSEKYGNNVSWDLDFFTGIVTVK